MALGQEGGVSEVGASVQVGAEIDLDMSFGSEREGAEIDLDMYSVR